MKKVISINENNFDDVVEISYQFLKDGKVVILPTDTVYGFSSVPKEENKIREIKNRDEKPFLYLISKISQLDYFKIDIEKYIKMLEKNWPDSITFLMDNIDNKKIGVRYPKDDFLTKVIDKLQTPIVSTSVNYSGCPILKDKDEIIKEFYDKVDLIIINDKLNNDTASTVVSLLENDYKIIREGIVKFKC